MAYQIPSVHDVQTLLQGFCHSELNQIGSQSGVPFPTIMKIRQGVTRNPGLETVHSILSAQLVSKAIKAGKRSATQKEVAHG